jgi:hypothetical protein
MKALPMKRASTTCEDRAAGSTSRCALPNEPAGHPSGIHTAGMHDFWVDDRSVHTALGMPTVWGAAVDDSAGEGRAR